ncbi:hypothetical protein SNOG_02134 [Parastagonospora nodorum SN15]|uniref:Carrier domain-containing protein n=1 Tax=Phaeosphaeria nodorum (strain SN15 / ATCC MYA-4574 / FGSC 10173) TaxID=321614 RepID=Q0V1I0_PHANO|nr:hypothetical protein SNOG_02134 [Parastagonospora nodorum SN15]EAT90346.2 hypothetical protein SNOG_02134 [Parastagonospora nodorum SN15]
MLQDLMETLDGLKVRPRPQYREIIKYHIGYYDVLKETDKIADELEFKLTLEFEPRSDHISYRATFDPSTIPEHQVNYLFWQIDAVVDLFLENVDCATADIAMCFQAELHSIANPVPRQISLHHGPAHAVEQWASTTPDREALVMSHRVNGSMQVEGYLTYAALNRLANQVARVLIHQGACPGCLVGVIMDKSINLYVAILAVLKIGAGYLPLVPDLPRERTKLILNEAQVTLCISESSASAHLDKSTSSKTINLDKIDVSLYLDDNLGIPYDGASVAYAVFTSGSTGTPKGVLVTHENLMSNLSYLSTVYPYSEGSKLLQSCSQAFDVSVFEIFFSWHVGICLCTARKDDLFSDLEGAINQLGITHLSLTPTVAALIDPDNVPQVKFLVTAGEAVTEHVRRKWAGRGLYQVRSSVSTSDLINNIGKPFDNTSAFVLDPTSETVLPRGAVGELCFGGYQVFQGYLNRPDLTAAKIINHPTYGRLYRSGDLGVMLADESILFTGRLDDQVKIRGQRVELGEISSTILDHGCVRDCTTLLLRDSSRPEILVTFWVPSVSEEGPFKIMKGRDFHAEIISIFDSLLNRLPAYMVPSYLVPVSRLPMTAQGKIDKRNLGRNFRELTEDMKAGTTVSQDVLTDEIGLSTSWEIQVADHLAEILGISVENINRNSSFFQLGLDSVSAIKLSNRLRKETLGDFTISAILKNPTVAHLEQLKAKCKRGNHTLNGTRPGTEDAIIPSETARIRTWFDKKDVAIAKIYPCTPLQEAMLSTGHSTATTSYSNVMAFFVKGDVLRLQQCWALMAQRHEILRTSFVATSDPSHAFAQVVLQDANLIWDEITWTREAFHVANKTVADLLQVNKPPVWLALARSNTSTRLLFCCHHAVYDGIAIQTLLNEVQEAYRDHKLPSPLSYDVYLQQMLLQNLAEADQFWTATFQDFEPTAFPDLTGRVHKELYTAAAWRRQLQLPLSTIRQACQNTSMTLLSVIHATWAKLLHYYTGESDACFGNVVSGRALSGHDLDRLVAPCFNTLPVRINFDFSNDNLALAQQVHTFNVESIDFQLTPLRRIQGLVLKDGGRLFDTLVILQQQSEPLDTTIWELEEDRGVMDLPLVCEISQNDTEDRLDLILHYHDSILSEREVTLVAETFEYAATTFDMCYYDCFLAWTLGFTLCAAEQDTMLNDLSKMINILDSDLLDLTPSVAASLERCEVPNVKWLYCIGEAMTSNIVKEWEGACVNSYGPSEAAFCTTICPVSQSFKPSVIGRPFSSTEFAIFPSKGDGLLPLLSVGELYIGGTQLARGYHGRPELTKEKFVTRSGRRFYRSGDVVRMLSDGNFEFIGRTDDQIKIRGLRVELGEINNILHGAHPDVQAAATQIMRKDDAAKEQLVAFLVAKRSVDEVEGEEIRRQLGQVAKDRLPLYMVPQFFIFVDKIHRSLAGKIDKKALTEIFRISVDANSLPNGISNLSSEHQWTIFESRIRDVFAHLSSSAPEDISPTTTIYQLGLDSISAVQVAAVLRREGHLVNAADVMRYLTCTDLAAFLNHNAAAEQPAAATFDFQKFDTKHRPSVLASCNVANEDIVAIRPCTPLQRGMISQMLAKEGAIYINYLRLDLKPGTDTNRLKKAWEIAAHAHMMLRTGFAHIQDKSHSFGMIEYAPNCLALPWDAPIKNAASVATEVWLEKLQREMARELHRPLWHVRIGQDNHTQFLDLVIFHGLFDAQSLQSVFQDVIAAYHDQQIESPVGLDPIIDGVLQRSTAYGDHGKEFWTQLGKQGCWSSYTGETFATCGVVLSGRDFEIAESAVFPCINTVPVSHKVTEDTEQMLSAITKLMAEVQQHQHIPLNDIQRLMGFSNEPLFDTIFAYQKLSTRKDLNNIWNIVDERATIEYPLSIELEPKGDFLEYRLTFLPHLIPQGQAKVMLEQLDHLLECFISHGKAANIADMTLYSIAPAMEPELPSEAQFLHDFVESTAMKYPGRVAFEFANSIHEGENHKQRWTYSQLNAEGNRVANLLIANAVQPGDLVCVCFDKCPEASFAMLGILKAGAAFVAIDPGAPAARQAFITRDSGATAVLSMSAQSAQFIKDVQVPVLNLDETKPSSYSSTPKACELTHENAVQALLAFQRLFDGHWNSESRWLQFASFHFDVSVLEQYWSWSVGICVVSAPRDVIFEDLADSINTLDITHIDLTPSLAQILHPDDVPSLCKGVFITGGESLKQEILNVWGPKGVIYNGYGPTEATIGCTMYTRVPANGKPSNIGKQFDNVGTFVLKPGTDIPVLRGGVGELCVSGKLVGKGYLKRKDLTAKGFPHLKRFNERVYRTGDLVRILYDGTFDFLGRADDQVKLRGQRLEIGEINSVIRQSNKSISDVATLVLKHPGQQKEQLVTFVIHGQATRQCNVLLASASEMMTVRDACHDNLPPYMIPTHFVPLTSMPLNINNKADAKKLKELYESLSAADLSKLSTSSDEYNQSWSDEERRLQDVLIKELHVNEDTIGKETSFFELGMDSISVIDVVRAMKQAGITSVTASLIMKHSTIRRLAKALSDETHRSSDRASVLAAQQAIAAMQHRHRRAVARALSISTHDIEAVAPCTPLQQGMIARSLDNDNGLYFNTFVFQLSKEINHEKLRAAWQVVHASAQILRTVFANTEDGYVQVVLRDVGSPWASNQPQHPYKGESLNGCLSRIHGDWVRSNTDQFGRPFELRLVQTQEKQILVIHIFHGLYDGISIELIFKAVWDAYNGRESNDIAPSFLSALPHGPLKVLDGAKAFWQEQISQDVSSHFLTRPPADFSGKVTKVTREMQDLGALESTRRKLNVTAQAIAQACWLDVLKGHVKAALTIGIVVSGRSIDLENADRIMGPMFNTIPYQNSHQHSETWESLIKRVHDFNVAAHPYQHTPLRDIMKWCKVDRSQSLFDNLFVYQVAQTSQACIKNDFWELLDGDTVADYPLAFEVEQGPNEKWSLTLVAQNHVLDEATSNVLLDRFEGALHQALTEPTATLETLLPPNGTIETIPEASNGLILPLNGTEKFAWTKEANVLRESLAELTSSELQSIDQSTSVFELGLDSIDAIKLSSKLKKQGIDLPVSGIMRGLTIAKMLAHIKRPADIEEDEISNDSEFQARKHELVGHAKRQGFSTDQIENVLPLTPLQEAMVVEMITSEFTRYYNFDVMKIDQDTDIERLKVAWTLVVQATPILRTSFVEVEEPDIEESYAQIIHAKPHPFWKEKTLDSEPDFSALFEEVRQEVSNAKSSSPPFHILLIRSTGQNYLLLAIAHALYDGWSLGLLHADVKSAYDGILKPRPSYQKTLSKILTRPEDNASDFWGDYLDQAEPSAFKRRPRAAKEKTDTVHRAERESTVSAASLTEFAKKSNVSLQTLGQSVFAVVLASYVQSLDVVFGSVLSGRDDETTLQLLFPTMNTIVVRTILHGTRIELVRHVQENFTSLKQWQHFPLRQALECAGQNGGLFESLFIYQKSMRKIEDLRPLYTSIAGHSDVEYPVCVEMEVVDGRLLWRCAVKDEVFDEDSAQELLDRLDRVLSEIMLQPDSPVIDFTSQGTSLCGLPPFDTDGRKDTVPAVRWSEITGQRQGQPREETIFAIREALAITAELSDEDVTDEMTIFHIGLDSISAIKVSSLLRKKRIILSVGDMLRAGTVINMARVADARFSQQPEQNKNTTSTIKHALQGLDHDDILNRANSEECMIKSLEEVQILPATAGQTYMLSMWLNTRGSNFFPEFTYSLSGKVSFRKLQDAWTSLVATSPILRTYIIAMQDPLVPYLQLVRKTEGNESRVFEITEHAEEKSSTGQPWAQLYAAQAEDGWTLKLKIHHALYDGVSLPILMQQLQAICNNGTEPRPNKTFEELVASSLGSQLRNSFWKSYFDGVSQTRLSQPQRSVNIRSEVFIPSLMPTKALEDSARQNGISIQALFLACYARLYATLTKTPPEQDIILGIYLANRSLPISGIESAAIPTVNLLPLRVRTPFQQHTVESAKRIQQDLQNIGGLTNATTSLWEIKNWTGVVVDTFVNFLTLPDAGKTHDGEGVTIAPTSDWSEGVNRVKEHEEMFQDGDEERMRTLRNESVNSAYLHAIDIEATVRNGMLDVGVFAPVEMLDLAASNKLLEDLQAELGGI